MLTYVEVFVLGGDAPLLPLSVSGIESDVIQVRDITGLEPVKASVNTTPFSAIDGESHNGNLVGKRNIILTLGFNPNWETDTIDSLRDFLYSYFMPKSGVTLRFFDTNRSPCEIEGWVESCNPILFSKDPEMQVSIICPKPYFIGSEAITIEGEVKLSLEIADGTIDLSEGTTIVYEGSIPTGFKLTITPSGSIPTYDDDLMIGIVHGTTEVIHFTGPVDATHNIIYSSVTGSKYLRSITDAEVITNLLGTVVDKPSWMTLQRGSNLFGVGGTVEGQLWTLEYYNRYGGL